jgi:hypothetical protein
LPKYTHHQVDISDLKYICFWCGSNRTRGTPEARKAAPTYIEFDLELHMLESHRMAMIQLPIGKGNMTVRVDYAVAQCKDMTRQLRENPELWNKLFSSSTTSNSRPPMVVEEPAPSPEEEQQQEEFIDLDNQHW